MSEYEVFYPGVYSDEDKKALDQYKATCAAINSRGPVDLKALGAGTLPEDTPGLSKGPFANHELKPWEIEYETSNYDPENPLYNDEDYARRLGFKGKLALPLNANMEGNAEPMPAELRDNLVISGLNHVVRFCAPVYPGDTVRPICNHRDVEELTPAEGSELRTFAIYGDGIVVNQKGEIVAEVEDRVKESLRRHTDPAKRNKTPVPVWECPLWWSLRPRHKYTDADWDKIKAIWAQEIKPHEDPVFWEDVNIGDEPFQFLEGPVTQLDTIKYHGLTEMGSPSLKVLMKDPMMSQALIHDEETGEYHEMNGVGHLEDGYVKDHRPAFYNFMPVNYVLRAAQDWIGNRDARIDTVAWRIMNTLPGYEADVPDFPDPDSYIGLVPSLAGKTITTHGMVGDTIWIRSYVVDKYEKNGKKYVKTVYWIQTIDEIIYQEGYVIVELPGRT